MYQQSHPLQKEYGSQGGRSYTSYPVYPSW